MIPKFKKLVVDEQQNDNNTADYIPLMGVKDESVPFSEETIFQFYSKSSSKPAPAKGSGEKLSNDD